MDIAKLQTLAQQLIEAVDGLVTEKHIEGVVGVLEGVARGIHSNWEKHITDETNEFLMKDNITCPTCDTAVQIVRRKSIINVDCT